MAGKDKELAAIGSIMEALSPLDASGRQRVLEYVLKRLDLETSVAGSLMPEFLAEAAPAATAGRTIKDIRSLTAEKQPRSANEMVAVVAYYLSELAGEGEASKTINTEAVSRYFKQARFPMPRAIGSALTNAAAAGYLENVGRGEYRLSPVGYNLVAHSLPRSGAAAPVAKGNVRKTPRRHR
jgi:hypothetical protein